MTPQQKADWARRRLSLRARVVRILNDIRAGNEITELDLDKLHNFCMVMLMLLSKVQPGVLDAAVKEAEIAAWIKGGIYDVVMDEELR